MRIRRQTWTPEDRARNERVRARTGLCLVPPWREQLRRWVEAGRERAREQSERPDNFDVGWF